MSIYWKQHFKAACKFGIMIGLLNILTGCISTPTISEAELSKYALLVPAENSSSAITKINGKRNFSLGGGRSNVPPGDYAIEIWSCPYGSISGCWGTQYLFHADAGKAYVFKGRKAEGIEVFDRDKLDRAPLNILPRTPEEGLRVADNKPTLLASLQQNGHATNGKWTKINTTEVASGYIDWTSFQRNGTTAKVWTLNDMKFPLRDSRNVPYSSITAHMEYDCKKQVARRLGMAFYEGNMATGEIRYSNYDVKAWESITQTSQIEAFMRAACQR